MQKLWDPGSLEALRKAAALMMEMDGGAETIGEDGVCGDAKVELGAGAMLADLAADVVGNESCRTVGW